MQDIMDQLKEGVTLKMGSEELVELGQHATDAMFEVKFLDSDSDDVSEDGGDVARLRSIRNNRA